MFLARECGAPDGFDRNEILKAGVDLAQHWEHHMNVGDERTKSLWMDVNVAPDATALTQDAEADIAVVGSGIAGLSAAYELAAAGQSVIVLDRAAIGSGMTSRTTAHLTTLCDDGNATLSKMRGEEIARLFHESQACAIDRIEAICKEHSIECNFRRLDGYLFPALGTDPSEAKETFEAELKAGRKMGLKVEMAKGVPLQGQGETRCLRYANQATFHPTRYLRGLAAAIAAKGGRLFADTAVESVEDEADSVTVKTVAGPVVHARRAVVATNGPIVAPPAFHSKVAPYRTYAMAFTVPRGSLPDALYWDTGHPYHYVRLNPGRGTVDYLIVGGGDHKSGEADDGETRFEALEAWMRNLLPALGNEVHRWSGQCLETPDYCGFIGRNPGETNVYIATGDSGQGMTHGALAGPLLKDLIVIGDSAWKEVYEPSRKPYTGIGNFLRENVTAVKRLFAHALPGEVNSADEIERGKGAILRRGKDKLAVYRDERGRLHESSAACTHMGCEVQWNSTEQCWDCPCHGSQFAPDGAVLNGPAVKPLAFVESKTEKPSKAAADA
jgi:glycine/D-amino acid oxidase-like deaminating enzyme/nitrite reductase/ring-hydroxylating ferredoxin subunit